MNTKTPSEILKKEQDAQNTDSVFDFLYHDENRIASLLAQFDPSGHLRSISMGKSAAKGVNSDAKIAASGGVPGIAKVSSDNKETVQSSHSEEIERVYDPMWSNARALLDTLDANQLIQRDLETAHLGQVVLIKGSLTFYDLAILSGLWEMTSVKKLIEQGLPKIPKPAKGQRNSKEYRDAVKLVESAKQEMQLNIDLFTQMLPTLPHTTQMQVSSKNGKRAWCTGDTSGLSVPTSDITLKHGLNVPGTWAMLGILDALPDDVAETTRQQSVDGSEMIAKLFESFAPILRTLMGRPNDAYGLTPLMVFREVTPGDTPL